MSTTDVTATELTDPELISRVREGDVAAYGTLFSRHVDAATRLGRVLVGPSDADDLVSEAFVKVLNVLLGGGGTRRRVPRLPADRRTPSPHRQGAQQPAPDHHRRPDARSTRGCRSPTPRSPASRAARRPRPSPRCPSAGSWCCGTSRWRTRSPPTSHRCSGMTANSVSALAYRAREGLRQAFLNMHSRRPRQRRLPRDQRPARRLRARRPSRAVTRRKVEEHLEHCRRCTAAYLELSEVNSSLAALLGPALLGARAAAYLGGAERHDGRRSRASSSTLDRGKDAVLAQPRRPRRPPQPWSASPGSPRLAVVAPGLRR